MFAQVGDSPISWNSGVNWSSTSFGNIQFERCYLRHLSSKACLSQVPFQWLQISKVPNDRCLCQFVLYIFGGHGWSRTLEAYSDIYESINTDVLKKIQQILSTFIF